MQMWDQWPIPVRLISVQAVLGGVLAIVWTICAGTESGLAALVGAAIAVTSNSFFATRMFLRSGQDPGDMLRGFISAEIMKLGLVVALFVVAIHWFAGQFLPVIATYAATSLVFLWALRWSDARQTKHQGSR